MSLRLVVDNTFGGVLRRIEEDYERVTGERLVMPRDEVVMTEEEKRLVRLYELAEEMEDWQWEFRR